MERAAHKSPGTTKDPEATHEHSSAETEGALWNVPSGGALRANIVFSKEEILRLSEAQVEEVHIPTYDG